MQVVEGGRRGRGNLGQDNQGGSHADVNIGLSLQNNTHADLVGSSSG